MFRLRIFNLFMRRLHILYIFKGFYYDKRGLFVHITSVATTPFMKIIVDSSVVFKEVFALFKDLRPIGLGDRCIPIHLPV
jgi:hypothetical protein